MDACTVQDTYRLHGLLDEWSAMLLKHAAESGSIDTIKVLLTRHESNQRLDQIMLESAARKGNADVLRYLLQQNPSLVIDDGVRSCALEGGVEVWKAILTHSPESINQDFGEKGDLISMAALMNNVPLLSFFLERGLDPNKSHVFAQPTLAAITSNPSAKQEIIDLLIKFGATAEDSAEANRKWRNL